jgi:hypothetical protein
MAYNTFEFNNGESKMQSKHIVRGVIFTAALALIAVLLAGNQARAQESKSLKINLAVSDERLLIYAGSSAGVKTGQKFTVLRDGQSIGSIVITEVKPTYSVAKVVEKSVELRDMDELVEWGKETSAAEVLAPEQPSKRGMKEVAAAAPSPAAEEKKEDATPAASSRGRRGSAEPAAEAAPAPAAAEQPAAEADGTSSRRRGRATSSESAEAAEPAPAAEAAPAAAESSSGRKRGRASGGSAEPLGDEPAASEDKKSAPEKKEINSPMDLSFATIGGMSGLWMVPTTDVLEKRKFAVGLYASNYSESMTMKILSPMSDVDTAYYGYWLDLKDETIALSYGLGKGLEVAFSQTRYHGSAMVYSDGGSSSASYDENNTSIALKYNPQKHFMLTESTNKKWETAFAVERFEEGNEDGTTVYGLVNFPFDKFDLHGGIFHMSQQSRTGKKFGTLAGVGMDISPELLFIGEVMLYQAQYTWNYAVRYIYKNQGSVLLGIADADDIRRLTLGLSYQF